MRSPKNGHERTPLPEALPRSIKAHAGRTPTGLTPVTIRGHGVTIEQHHRDYVREKLGHKLARVAPDVERVYVRFDDENGPKGGVDHVCRVQVTMSGMGVVIAEERDVDPITAFDLVMQPLLQAIDHRVGRARETPVHLRRRQRERRRNRIGS